VDLDLVWPRDNGEVFRGRNPKTGDDAQPEEREEGELGSVDLRVVAGLNGLCTSRSLFWFSY